MRTSGKEDPWWICQQIEKSSIREKKSNIPNGNTLVDEVKVDLDVLRVLVLNGVRGEIDGVDVVAVNESAPGKWVVELLKKLLKSIGLSHTIVHTTILSLRTQAGDNVLQLG